ALSAAHAAGIVHRDIKPGNILLCADGTVKVTDFGIARAAGSSAVTTAGTLLGTPHYISPEQVNGDNVTAASDFYALGAVAYECLTGARLYDGDAMSVMLAHRDSPPPTLPDGFPDCLRDIVMAHLDLVPARWAADGCCDIGPGRQLIRSRLRWPALRSRRSSRTPATVVRRTTRKRPHWRPTARPPLLGTRSTTRPRPLDSCGRAPGCCSTWGSRSR